MSLSSSRKAVLQKAALEEAIPKAVDRDSIAREEMEEFLDSREAHAQRDTGDYMDRGDMLKHGLDLTYGDRNAQYGDPLDSCTLYANLWSIYLSEALGMEIELQPDHVAVMNALMKIGRTCNSPTHEDNYVDAAVYMAMGGEIANRTLL